MPSHLRLGLKLRAAASASIDNKAVTNPGLGAALSDPWYECVELDRAANDNPGMAQMQREIVQSVMDNYGVSAVQARRAAFELMASTYTRAVTACLEGRGYQVNSVGVRQASSQ